MKKDQIHEGLLRAAKKVVGAVRKKFQQSGQKKISSLGGQPSKTNLEAGSKALGKLGKNENLSYRDYIDLEQQRAGSSDRRKSVMVRRRGRGARILLTRPRRGGAPR